MQNPFHDIVKADELPPDVAAELFIKEASPIWSDLQHPVNHIIVGPRGAGKTIALRQLDHKSAASPGSVSYAGVYVQISKVSTVFQTVFASPEHPRIFSRAFADYLWLEIMKEMAGFLRSMENAATDGALISRITDGVIDVESSDMLEERCSSLQKEIEEAIDLWSIHGNCTWIPRVRLPLSLDRAARALRRQFPHLNQDRPSLCLLFDESSPIPAECQRTINGLLHRGRAYCVKLAVRPYEWSTLTTDADRKIELDTDVKPLHIQYPNELENSYISSMQAVANKILQSRAANTGAETTGRPPAGSPDIAHILADDSGNYSGFDAVCAASSGNPQNLLSICSCIFATAISERSDDGGDAGLIHISGEIQNRAIVRWSKDYEDQNPYPGSQAFCRSLVRLVRNSNDQTRSIGFACSPDDPDLFTSEYLPDEVGKLIKPAFSAGFIRNSHSDRSSLFAVPSEFYLNRGLLPRDGLDLHLPASPAREIDSNFIKKSTRENVFRNTGNQPKDPPDSISAFLSTSFSPRLEQQRSDIKQALQREQVQCIDLSDASGDQFLFTSIRKAIDASDVTILDATVLRPYTMLEIGMCAGGTNPKSVICVVNDEDKDDALAALPDYMKHLPVSTFSFTSERLARLAADVRIKCLDLISKPSEFKTVAITDTSLRPRRRQHSIFLSLPRSPIRERAIAGVKARLKDLRWTVVVEDDMTSYSANDFQVSIQCAYTCRVAVIDTTGDDGPDLLQCYKLGLFAGRRAPWRARRVENGKPARSDPFASVPGLSYGSWDTIEELAQQVESFIKI